MEKLDITFVPAQVLKAEVMNIMKDRINELVVEANKLPEMVAATATNKLEIDALKESEVNIKQSVFDEMLAAGTLDPTKTYNTYEE